MIEERGVVVAVEDNAIIVETQRQSVCGACVAKSGCGSAVMASFFGKRRNLARTLFRKDVKVGQQVVIGLSESALLKSSVAIYLVPLILVFVFALAGDSLARYVGYSGELPVLLAALFGVVAGVQWLRRYNRNISRNELYQPTILSIIGSGEVIRNHAVEFPEKNKIQ